MTETWISREEFLRLANYTKQWLCKAQNLSRILTRETNRKLPNGRYAREYAVSSLPLAGQERYAEEQKQLTVANAQIALPLPLGPCLVEKAPRIFAPQAAMPEAEARYKILEPILAMRDEATRTLCAGRLRLADGRSVDSQNRMCEYQIEQAAARGERLAMRTLKLWLARYKAAPGITTLARQRRKDANRSQWFDQPGHYDAACLVAYLHLGNGILPGLSAQSCYEMLRVECALVKLTEDDLPHYDTVRRFLAGISPALKVFATRGRKEFGERMLPYISRAYNEPANDIWISDHTITDVEVMNDCIPGAPLGAPIRLRLTAIIDYRSRYLVGYSWCWEGSSASIATALRHAISTHGPCRLWYSDNGKDYKKVAKGAMPGSIQPDSMEAEEWVEREMRLIEQCGILARLGIQVTRCLPYHPQSKHVERFFRTVHGTFCKLWPTYTGGKPSERPDQTTALMHVHRQALRRGDLTQSRHPLASEFIAAFERWIDTYHSHRHGGRGMSGRTPGEVFTAERSAQQEVTTNDLALLFYERGTRKVHECQIRLNKIDYVPSNALQSRLMLDRNERTVTVAYDPLDPTIIAVLDDSGHLVTTLEAKRLLRMAPEDEDTQTEIGKMMQMRGALVRSLKDDHTAIITIGNQLGVVHPLHLLSSAAKISGAAHSTADRITPRKPKQTIPAASSAPKYQYQAALEILEEE